MDTGSSSDGPPQQFAPDASGGDSGWRRGGKPGWYTSARRARDARARMRPARVARRQARRRSRLRAASVDNARMRHAFGCVQRVCARCAGGTRAHSGHTGLRALRCVPDWWTRAALLRASTSIAALAQAARAHGWRARARSHGWHAQVCAGGEDGPERPSYLRRLRAPLVSARCAGGAHSRVARAGARRRRRWIGRSWCAKCRALLSRTARPHPTGRLR